ncbi:hypothetical protein ACFL2H_06785 [Planctomycetota bacterium]
MIINRCTSTILRFTTGELQPRACCAMVVSLATACLALVATMNFVVDPYAQYASDVFEPLVQTSRAQKVQLLADMQPLPEGLVLGSSRVMKIEPDVLQRSIGFTFLNVGVNHAKPEDHLAILRHYRSKHGRMPKCVVLGLDVNSFSDRNQTDARLLSNSDLLPHVSDSVPLSDRFQRWRELFGWQQTKMSITSICHPASEERRTPLESFRPDGLLVYHQREQEIADGTYDFQSALDYTKREYKQLLFDFDRLSKRRCGLFEALAEECRQANCRLFVFLTPMHPELRSYIASSTTYKLRKDELRDFLLFQAKSRGFAFVDLSDVSQFDGDPQLFVDGVHPLEPNTRKMIQRFVSTPDLEGDYAVQ